MKMETFKPEKVKARKTKMAARKSNVRTLSNLFFRALEVTVVVVTVAKLFYQLVVTLEISGERFKGLTSVLANRHFVFFFGNALVIALLAKYGQFPSQEPDARSKSNGFYEEFVRESGREERNSQAEMKNRGTKCITEEGTTEILTKQSETAVGQRQSSPENEGVTEAESNGEQITTDTTQRHITSEIRQKESVVEIEGTTRIRGMQRTIENRQRQNKAETRPRHNTGESRAKQSKGYTRSRSENLQNPKVSSCGRLRRSETERSLHCVESMEETREGMSNDELRYKIESFIARQRRNQKDEEFCIT